jgi:hypothetical protein
MEASAWWAAARAPRAAVARAASPDGAGRVDVLSLPAASVPPVRSKMPPVRAQERRRAARARAKGERGLEIDMGRGDIARLAPSLRSRWLPGRPAG